MIRGGCWGGLGLLGEAGHRKMHGRNAVTVLALLVQYRKYESSNPYILQLSILDQEIVLHGYSHVVTSSLAGKHHRACNGILGQRGAR